MPMRVYLCPEMPDSCPVALAARGDTTVLLFNPRVIDRISLQERLDLCNRLLARLDQHDGGTGTTAPLRMVS